VATTTQLAIPSRTASPIVLWHLLSLDAPTVAALWVCFIARAARIQLPFAAPAAMALAVWMLYAADRLLDARLLDARLLDASHAAANELEARHIFHHRHARAFLIGIAVAAIALAALLPRLDPAAIRLYLIEGALLSGWFIILHATRSAHRLPKEIAVGLFFSAATFIPTVARVPSLRVTLIPAAILFAALCSLNCLFIYAWEHDRPTNIPPHATTSLALAHLPALASTTAIAGAAIAFLALGPAKPFAAACILAAVLLLVLHRNRRRLSRIDLRAAADLALLTPLLLLPFLR
jgi:hypothetical protein